MWSGGSFRYNTAVVNVNTTVVRNVYVDRTVINNTAVVNNRTSFNGPGGIAARPTPQEQVATHEQHIQPTSNQLAHQQFASRDRTQLASVNHGAPAVTAMNTVNTQRPSPQARVANSNPPGGSMSGQPGNTPQSNAAHLNQPQNKPNHSSYAGQQHGNPPPKAQRPKGESHPQEHSRAEPRA
jgi:hypothetical protein